MQSSPERSPQRARGLGPAVRVGHRPVPRRQRESTPSPRSRAVRVRHIGGLWPEAEGLRVRHATSRGATASARHVASWGRGVVPGHRRHQAACCSPTGWTAREPTWMRFHRLIATMSKASLTCSTSDEVDPDGVTWALARFPARSRREGVEIVLTLATAPRPHGRRRGAERASSLRRAQG